MSELDRIIGRNVSQEIREKWVDLIPKLIAIAAEEQDNSTIATITSDVPADLSDGRLLKYTHMYMYV